MPLRLKSLELVGYKTFASKTEFEFSDDVTVIVGPNGSGKSNIADALRWVLGEQSYALMRGRKTDDMIFAGSEGRARAGMAAATVTFDNSDGWLPIDFSEVSITRRAYRDGRNDYMINGQRVRLMDVTELLSKSGLAERTYTIIGQGLVDTALSLKAEERRRLFEEAAGIGLYRKRKQQALRRLDQTKRNLERVGDILAELAPRLRSLSRQAKRAEDYAALRSELQAVLREWYGFHWHRAQRELLDARGQANQQEQALEKARTEHAAADGELTALRDQINGLRARLGSWHRELAELHSKREETSRDLAVSDERQRALLERQTRITAEVGRLEDGLAVEQERFNRAQARLDTVQDELDDAPNHAPASVWRTTCCHSRSRRCASASVRPQPGKQMEQPAKANWNCGLQMWTLKKSSWLPRSTVQRRPSRPRNASTIRQWMRVMRPLPHWRPWKTGGTRSQLIWRPAKRSEKPSKAR